MSLTSHLDNSSSPIGQYIKQHFACTKVITSVANQQLKQVSTLLPAYADKAYPYATLGTVIDYRLRYAFDITPYTQFVAWHGARMLALQGRQARSEPGRQAGSEPGRQAGSEPGRQARSEPGRQARSEPGRLQESPRQYTYSVALLKTFFECLDTTVRAMQPVGRLLSTEDEQLLCRYCYVLSLFEQVFRTGYENVVRSSPLFVPSIKGSVEELLGIPQEAYLDDVAAIFRLFYEKYHSLLSKPHNLNPIFAGSLDVSGADADLIVDGCLIDIKSSISPKLTASYLFQLAGYLLLDYDDALHITSVGIYMARQGMLFTWPVPEFIGQLTGDEYVNMNSLRREFRERFGRGRR